MTPWHADDSAALARQLTAVDTAARQMFAVLEDETRRLKDREPPTPAMLHEKAGLADQLDQARQDFDKWRHRLARAGKLVDDSLELSLIASSEPGTQDQLERFQATRELLLLIEKANAVNGQLLHRLHRRNQLFGQLLQQDQNDPLYSRSGQLNDRDRNVLVRA